MDKDNLTWKQKYGRKYYREHREERLKNYREWRMRNKEKRKKTKNSSSRKTYHQIKDDILKLLGGKCIRCGYQGVALQIDHINGGGLRHLRNCSSVIAYYRQILQSIMNGSKDYQLLCANHNWEKRIEHNECRRKR